MGSTDNGYSPFQLNYEYGLMNETLGPWEFHYSEILSCRDTAPGYDQGCSCTNCEDACYTPTDPTTTTTSEDPTTTTSEDPTTTTSEDPTSPWVSLHCEVTPSSLKLLELRDSTVCLYQRGLRNGAVASLFYDF